MNDLKSLVLAFKKVSERLSKLENRKATQDGYTPVKGIDYFDGRDGKDGKDGKDGQNGRDGSPFTFDMFTPEQIDSLRGKDGRDGSNGKDGKDGRDGKNGLNGIGKDGKDGRDGEDGEDGRGIEDVNINKSGHLIVTFTDGTKKDVGKVRGEDGKNGYGVSGLPGKDGIGVDECKVNEDGHLIVTYDNGVEQDAGAVGSGIKNGIVSDTINSIWTGTKSEYLDMEHHDEKTLYLVINVRKPFMYNHNLTYNDFMLYNGEEK